MVMTLCNISFLRSDTTKHHMMRHLVKENINPIDVRVLSGDGYIDSPENA